MEGPPQFRVFGPLRVRPNPSSADGFAPSDGVGGHRERALLAALLLTPGAPVEVDQLAQLLWPDRKPRDVGHALRTHVMRLRRHIGRDLIETMPGAYSMPIEATAVDAHLFDALVRRGMERLGRREFAACEADLAEALEVWQHGKPWVDLAGTPPGDGERARLVEERLEVEERLAAVRLRLHRRSLDLIEKLAAERPLRETRSLLLMHALFVAGQQARALRCYSGLQRQLRRELGIDPDPRLQEMEQRILNQDAGLLDLDPLTLVLD